MNVLIVDDEPPARDRLRGLLGQLSGYHLCGEATNGAEALRLAANLVPDIVLLDIQMPGLDGLETAARLATLEKPPAIVFVTAYSQYALDAFDAHAVGYLLKPIRLEHLERVLASARRLNRAQLASLAAEPAEAGRTHLRVRLGQRLELCLQPGLGEALAALGVLVRALDQLLGGGVGALGGLGLDQLDLGGALIL